MKHLVILAPNWLGDAVMALPAIADVRRASPHATIAVAARGPIAPLFSLVPGMDETIVLPAPPSIGDVGRWSAIGAELTNRAFDTALVLPNSIHAALVASRAGIPERWGYRTPFRGRLLTRAIARGGVMHQAEYYQRLVRELGVPSGPLEPRVAVPDAARAAGDRLLGDAGWDGTSPLVALAPGAAYGGAKRWPPESFAELASTLAADGITCVMIGSAADAATATEINARLKGSRSLAVVEGSRSFAAAETGARGFSRAASGFVLDLVGKTDLPTLAGVLTRCRALVTNDSGAMHLAAAAGVKVAAVFGPTNEHATRPLGDAHVVIMHPVWCRPCMLRECPIDHRCMRGVRPAAVVDAARRML
jgi:lipopolysaccharide heptosyltransferase II